MRPWPRQVGHQPLGELKEKCFGSSSGKDSPLWMSVRVVENQLRISPVGVKRKQEPFPIFSALSKAEDRGRRTGDGPVGFFLSSVFCPPFSALRSATTTSTSCSL